MRILLSLLIGGSLLAQFPPTIKLVDLHNRLVQQADWQYEVVVLKPKVDAFLVPAVGQRGLKQVDRHSALRHWDIRLKDGATIRQAFSSMGDLGCGPMPVWNVEHLVHAIERYATGFLKPESLPGFIE